MADTAPAQAAPQKKAAKKAKKPAATHPVYKDMVLAAVASLKDRKGSSRQAILKYILSNYKGVGDEKQVNSHLKLALKRMTDSGDLKHVKGTGASGSFRPGAVKAKAAPKKKVASKKPKAKKAAPKKKAAKKPKAKKAAAKAPAKPATKPKAAKPAKKTKKAKKPAAKPKAAKPAAKKASKGKKKSPKKSKSKK